jgi:enamine deaminase RidA (YjgF/YER057c/UK114 family)
MSKIETKSTPSLAGGGTPYAYAVKAGPFIFLTGHEAFDFDTGSTAAAVGPAGFPMYGRTKYRREGDFILQRMNEILKSFGSDLSNGLRLDQYYPTVHPVDPYHFSRRAEFGSYIPPSTSVVMDRCFNAACSISTSLIAVAPDEDHRIERVQPQGVNAPAWSGFAPTVTCNDFIFIAGQMATDGTDGLHPKVRIPDHAAWGGTAIRKQTEFLIVDKLKPAMEAAGSSLENAVKAQIYIADVNDYSDCMDVWNAHFADIPCAVTCVPAREYGTIGGIVEINLIGLKADAKRKKTVVSAALPDMAAEGPCVRVGEFLLPSGLIAIGADGSVAGAGLSGDFGGLAHAGYAQASAVYDYAEALCAAAGTSMANMLRAQYFMADIRDFAGVQAAWAARQGDQPHPFVCIEAPGPLQAPDAALVADFWIYAPE